MLVIKLNAIDSTNTYLRRLHSAQTVADYTVVVTGKQLKGRGQMGAEWTAEAGKNLTFSVFKELESLDVAHRFYINIVVSLALVRTLKSLNIPDLNVKWPNDILSDKFKICGILIETVIKNNRLDSCVIGIGLNVNQTHFENLPRASSLKMLTGRMYQLDLLLNKIVETLQIYFDRLHNGEHKILKAEYEACLYRSNMPSAFKDADGNMFMGCVKGVTEPGKLKVLLEDDTIQTFDLKEVTLMY